MKRAGEHLARRARGRHGPQVPPQAAEEARDCDVAPARGDVLIVEDDAPLRRLLSTELRDRGYVITRRRERARCVRGAGAAAVRPGAHGFRRSATGRASTCWRTRARRQPGVPVLVPERDGHHRRTLVRCEKAGAFDFLQKPLDSVAAGARRSKKGHRSGGSLTARGAPCFRSGARPLKGQTPSWMRSGKSPVMPPASKIRSRAWRRPTPPCSSSARAAPARSWSRARSTRELARATRPFVAVNCAALPEAPARERAVRSRARRLHRRGRGARTACFETAHGGTLFLDEIGELPLDAAGQAARACSRSARVRRVGGDTRCARSTCASSRRPTATSRAEVDERPLPRGSLLPPQRGRASRCRRCASGATTSRCSSQHFLARSARASARPRRRSRRGDARALERYRWPGNVRELRNVVERAVILAPDGVVRRSALPSVLPRTGGVEALDAALRRAESEAIRRALRASPSRSEAARRLGNQSPRALRQARAPRPRRLTEISSQLGA